MKKWPWFVGSLVIVCMDQLSKYWAEASLQTYQSIAVCPLLKFTLAYNSGAAFSFLSGAGAWHRWVLAGFSVLMSLLLVALMSRSPRQMRLQLTALSFILGGAIGNLIDRVSYGYVIDFIDVYYKHYHWPVFNVADSAICLGVFLLFIDLCKKDGNFQVG